MTEEEKKAIEYWKEKLKSYKEEIKQRQNDEFKGYGTLEDVAKLKYWNLHTILNLIEKQQYRIKDLEKALIDEDYKHRQEIEKIKKELESLKDFKDIAENKVTELNPIGLARANQLLSRQCHNLQEEIEKKEFEIKALQMEHDHDVKMIDEVKGEAVKLYKIIDEMAKVLADYKYEELICIEVDCEHIELQNGGKCIGDKNCIKEYFKKKVEGK